MNALAGLMGHVRFADVERAVRRRCFAPPPRLTLSEWADQHRYLSPEGSAEPGRWRTSRAPFLREVMDACSDPAVERVVFMKPAQIGGTEVANNFVGYFMDQDPSPILIVQPTVEVATLWSKERLDPMLRDTPVLRGKVHEGNRREKDQSILRKVFPGGYLAAIGANSASGLRSRPVRAVLADEVDAYAQSAKGAAKKDSKAGAMGEGDPLSLAIKRTSNFWNRKILEISTPTVRGVSRIERDYEASDQRQYEVACPFCGHWQVLHWRHVVWEAGERDSAAYRCGEVNEQTGELTAGCGDRIPEHYKMAMLAEGRWVARRPGRRIRGYWLNALYSPWQSWAGLAREWMEAQGQPEELKVFVNTRLAETWEDAGERLSADLLGARREAFASIVPAGAGLLTAAVDVQGDRLEAMVMGWGHGREAWRVRLDQIWGDPAKEEVWQRLDTFLAQPWTHTSGTALPVSWTFVDSGGHHTDAVYRYCKARRGRNVHAIKGMGDPGKAAVGRPGKRNKWNVPVFPLGVVALKDIATAMLRTDAAGPGFFHLPTEATDAELRQYASEKKVLRYVSGRPQHTYILMGGRTNEAWDLLCYNIAALIALGAKGERAGLEADRLMAAHPLEAEPPPAPVARRAAAPPRSSWATRWKQ